MRNSLLLVLFTLFSFLTSEQQQIGLANLEQSESFDNIESIGFSEDQFIINAEEDSLANEEEYAFPFEIYGFEEEYLWNHSENQENIFEEQAPPEEPIGNVQNNTPVIVVSVPSDNTNNPQEDVVNLENTNPSTSENNVNTEETIVIVPEVPLVVDETPAVEVLPDEPAVNLEPQVLPTDQPEVGETGSGDPNTEVVTPVAVVPSVEQGAGSGVVITDPAAPVNNPTVTVDSPVVVPPVQVVAPPANSGTNLGDAFSQVPVTPTTPGVPIEPATHPVDDLGVWG